MTVKTKTAKRRRRNAPSQVPPGAVAPPLELRSLPSCGQPWWVRAMPMKGEGQRRSKCGSGGKGGARVRDGTTTHRRGGARSRAQHDEHQRCHEAMLRHDEGEVRLPH